MITRLRCKQCFNISKFEGKLEGLPNFKYNIVKKVTTSKKSKSTGKVTKSTKTVKESVICPVCKTGDRFEYIGEVKE